MIKVPTAYLEEMLSTVESPPQSRETAGDRLALGYDMEVTIYHHHQTLAAHETARRSNCKVQPTTIMRRGYGGLPRRH